jgi:hypothetical protein
MMFLGENLPLTAEQAFYREGKQLISSTDDGGLGEVQTSLQGVKTGNSGRLLLVLVLLSVPAFQAACQTHEARARANDGNANLKPADGPRFADWNINPDDYLVESEFTTGFERGQWFSNADQNKDNYLDPEEFKSGTTKLDFMARWDTNGDGRIDKKEAAQMGEKTDSREWDQDKSGDLNNDELKAAVFELWDSNHDSRIDQDEFALGWFNHLDTNHDHRLVAAEFDRGFKG